MFNNKTFVLLPVHNNIIITKIFIKQLNVQTLQDFTLILIDDGSTDGTGDLVKSIIPDLEIIKGSGNWWWGGSLHQAYKWLLDNKINPDNNLLIINNDAEIESNFLEKGINILNENKNSLVCAQSYDSKTNKLHDKGVHADWRKLLFNQAESIREINCLSTRGLFMRVGDFLKIGGFHPLILPHYLSDYEFTIRAHRKGYNLITDPGLRLWNDQSISGIREYNDKSHISLFKKIFSKKAVSNPIYWSTFIILACPWRWKLLNLIRVWLKVLKFAIEFYKKKIIY